MLESCLRHKIIRDFLQEYNEDKWPFIVPTLLEIAILNLKASFKTNYFSEEEFKNILYDLKENLYSYKNKNNFNEKSNKKPSDEWRNGKDLCYEDYEIICKDRKKYDDEPFNNFYINKDFDFYYEDGNYDYNKRRERKLSFEKVRRDNDENRKNIRKTKSKIKELVDLDKKKYRSKNKDKRKKHLPKKIVKRINYAISYDKDLKPEKIERKIDEIKRKK